MNDQQGYIDNQEGDIDINMDWWKKRPMKMLKGDSLYNFLETALTLLNIVLNNYQVLSAY